MKHTHTICRRTVHLSLIVAVLLTVVPESTLAVPAVSKVYLRPHCENTKQEECATFTVKDPESLVASPVKVGEVLDMDLILQNEGNAGIERLRAWIAYDPSVLEGVEITPSAAFPVPTPDEQGFEGGYAKIQATTRSGKASGPLLPLARIRFRVTALAPSYTTILSLYDVKAGTDGHTFVTISKAGDSGNLLAPKQSALFVPTQPGTAPSTNSSQASSHSSSQPAAVSSTAMSQTTSLSSLASAASSSAAPATDHTVFTLLQPQNLRVTTDGSTVYLAWDALRSGSLGGYHLYYGTRSGEYLQRRALPAAQTNVILRSMPVDTTYYFALRGVDTAGDESAFSQEQAVKVGNPSTSTNPLLGTGISTTAKNPLTGSGGLKTGVPGQTGLPPAGLLILLVCAGMGTLFAVRRQLTSHHP